MAFEKNKFMVAKKAFLQKGELAVECNIDTQCSVQKVLAVHVSPCVGSSEVLSGVVNYGGSVDVKIIFMTNEGEISSVSSVCPFSSRFEGEEIVVGGCPFINVDIIDYSCEVVGDSTVKVAVVVVQSGFIVFNKEESVLHCDDESVCYQNEDMEVLRYAGCGQDVVEIESDINIRENIKKILLTESKVLIKNVEAGANYVAVSGDVISRILYISENDKFESGYIYDSFKQEVELAGTNRDSLVEGYGSICQEKVVAEIVQDEKGCRVVVKNPITLSVFAYDNQVVSVITDIYGTKEEINVVTNSFDMTELCGSEVVEGKIEGSLVLEEDKPRVDKVLFNGGARATITNQYVRDGEIFIEGIAQTTVVYLNDETSQLYSVVVDVPFVVSDKTNCKEGRFVLQPTITDVDIAVKKGREFIFAAKVKIKVVCSCQVANAVICDAVAGGLYAEKDYAMEVIFAKKGSGLWQTAKLARVKEEQILFQNPDVIFPVEEDTPLILFYQKQA